MRNLKGIGDRLEDSLSRVQENANSMKILAIILSISGIIDVTWAFITQNFMMMVITIILLKFSLRFFKKPDKNVKTYKKEISGER